MPLADEPDAVPVAMANPRDAFAVRAIEVKLGRPVARRAAVRRLLAVLRWRNRRVMLGWNGTPLRK